MAKKHSLEFGKKEKVLNYACQTYQLSRPNKVGAVMELIRQCQPQSLEDWETWYFSHAYTSGKAPIKITPESLHELGHRLHEKITEVVIPEWQEAFRQLTLEDCIDYIGHVGLYAFGIQIKPITARSNFGNYAPSERMRANFSDFEERYGGKVFIVYSLDGEIAEKQIIQEIQHEIERLTQHSGH